MLKLPLDPAKLVRCTERLYVIDSRRKPSYLAMQNVVALPPRS